MAGDKMRMSNGAGAIGPPHGRIVASLWEGSRGAVDTLVGAPAVPLPASVPAACHTACGTPASRPDVGERAGADETDSALAPLGRTTIEEAAGARVGP